jgi:DNA-binding transcriptional ArsR family regulator
MKSLGHPARLAIVQLLADDEACVCHLSAALSLSQPKISQHLMSLRKAGLVRSRREGKNIFYRLTEPELPELLAKVGGSRKDNSRLTKLAPAQDCPCPHCRSSTRIPSDQTKEGTA